MNNSYWYSKLQPMKGWWHWSRESEDNLSQDSIYPATSSIGTSNGNHKETWDSRVEFVLSCVGFSVGLGNVWRFPYLAYKHGGAAFLIPYTILLVLVGRPVYFLELAVGQFSSLGSIAVWKCCPIGKGIGWAMHTVVLIVSTYYNVLSAYSIYYMASCFATRVPWDDCHDWWGANDRCYLRKANLTDPCRNFTGTNEHLCNSSVRYQTASTQYWRKHVLHIDESSGISDLGPIRWELAICLLAAWFITFLCLIKGIKSTGKVVYFTATFPYVVLLLLFIEGLTLKGSQTGLAYLFIPEWSKLLRLAVWKAAAEQMFFSLAISWGPLIAFGSYNNFRNRTHIDAFVVSLTDFATSLLSSAVIFSILGYLAHELNISVDKVASKGPGLIFEVYPEALALLPFAPVWSFLFFFMLLSLGLNSMFALLESALRNFQDQWPNLKKHYLLLTACCCICGCALGLPCVTNGGQYVLNLMDLYGAGSSVMLISFCEIVCFSWIYGAKRLMTDIGFMLNYELGIFWFISWGIICPVILGIIFITSQVFYTRAMYGDYVYPSWAESIGLCIECVSVIQIPIWAIVILCKFNKKEDFFGAFTPTEDWGPSDPENRQEWIVHQLSMRAKRNDDSWAESTFSLQELPKASVKHEPKTERTFLLKNTL